MSGIPSVVVETRVCWQYLLKFTVLHADLFSLSFFFNFLDFFFMRTIFVVSIYCTCYNTASVSCFGVFGHKACGISPQPGIKPVPPPLEGEGLTPGPPRTPTGRPFHCALWVLSIYREERILQIHKFCWKSWLTQNYLSEDGISHHLKLNGWHVFIWLMI